MARAKARRAVPLPAACSECGEALGGQAACDLRVEPVREQRFRRLHPEAYAAKEARKVERRREKRRERLRGGPGPGVSQCVPVEDPE